MNRFGSGYDDLFRAFGVEPQDADPATGDADDAGEASDADASGSTRPTPSGDLRPPENPEELAAFLAKAMKAVEDLDGPPAGRFGGGGGGSARRPGKPLAAPVDVMELPDGLLIVFDLPGVMEQDVELAAAPRAIRLRASRRLPLPPGASALRRERAAGTIERIIPVPPGFESGSLEARLEAGVLAVMVPRHEASGRDGWDQQGGSGLWNEG